MTEKVSEKTQETKDIPGDKTKRLKSDSKRNKRCKNNDGVLTKVG